MARGWQNLGAHDRNHQDHLEEMVGRNMDVKDHSGESSEGSEEHSRESLYHLGKYRLP